MSSYLLSQTTGKPGQTVGRSSILSSFYTKSETPVFLRNNQPLSSEMGSRFTEDEIAEYREAFELFDSEKTGAIGEEQLSSVMDSLGQDMTRQELRKFMDEIDTDGNGTIEFSEFLEMMAKMVPENNKSEEVDDITLAFKIFDQDGDGFVSRAELRHVLTNLGEGFTDEDIDEIVDENDSNHDGVLSFSEFRSIFENDTPVKE